MAQKAADAALNRVIDALARYDAQLQLVAAAEMAWDPGPARAAKDEAQRAFRARVAAARDRYAVETAAHVWLDDINRINAGVRAAQMRIRRERDGAAELLTDIDRLCVEAGASRNRADTAVEECRSAVQALEAQAGGRAPGWGATLSRSRAAATPQAETRPALDPAVAALEALATAGPQKGSTPGSEAAAVERRAASSPPAGPARPAPTLPPPPDETAVPQEAIDLRSSPPQAVVDLVRGDEGMRLRLVHELSGADPLVVPQWQSWLFGFVDAARAAAIDAGYLKFPETHPFWGLFTKDESRAVARSLAALGFCHDGQGNFADRSPSQHDLVLAVGSAGLLPVKVRHWPRPADIANIYCDVGIAAEELLADRAPHLTLGEVVSALGWRAEPLADLWNEWPRVRPLLLVPDEA